MALRVHIEFTVGRRPLLQAGLAALLVAVAATELVSEDVLQPTYYPSPGGVYRQIITTGATYLATGGSNVGINLSAAPANKLAIAAGGLGITGTPPIAVAGATAVGLGLPAANTFSL